MEEERHPLLTRSFEQPTRLKWKTNLACGCVLISKTFERIAFYGVVGNLLLFLNHQPLNWMSYNAANALLVFTGIAYMISVFGGWVADSFLGKYKTIVLGFFIYVAGYIFLPLLTPGPNISMNKTLICSDVSNASGNSTQYISPGTEACAPLVYAGLTIIALGVGFVTANIAPFGAEQIQHEGPIVTRKFFNWFYWCINLGSLLALGGVAYLQQNFSFFWGFILPCICLVIGLIIFTIGRMVYIIRATTGSVLSNVCRILLQSCQRRKHVPAVQDNDSGPVGCLDMAKVRYGGDYNEADVNDVRTLFKILLLFIAMIPYWIVYFQMETTYVMQGLHMRLSSNYTSYPIDHPPFKIAIAWLSLFDVIFLVALIPIMDQLVYPALDRRGIMFSLRARIAIGMVFAIASVVLAGGIEYYRLHVYWHYPPVFQKIGKTVFHAADISVFIQVPQYALIGISEVFASIAGLELAYSLAPRSMQSLIMGLFWFTQGVAGLLGTASMYWFQGLWFFSKDHGDINYDRLDKYFYFLAGVQGAGLIIFLFIAWYFDVGGNSGQATTSKPEDSRQRRNSYTIQHRNQPT